MTWRGNNIGQESSEKNLLVQWFLLAFLEVEKALVGLKDIYNPVSLTWEYQSDRFSSFLASKPNLPDGHTSQCHANLQIMAQNMQHNYNSTVNLLRRGNLILEPKSVSFTVLE